MIKKITENITTIVEFGHGDIRVCSGMQEENGVLAFKDLETTPRPIGEKISRSRIVDITDFPVVLRFTNIMSIDVLIEALETIKEGMESNANE